MKREMQRPSLGCAFDPDQRNEREIVEAYISELEWYRPRGFAKLRSEGVKLLNKEDDHEDWQWAAVWRVDCDNLLTEHAQHYGLQHFIYGPFEHGGAVGYYVNIEGAKASDRVDAVLAFHKEHRRIEGAPDIILWHLLADLIDWAAEAHVDFDRILRDAKDDIQCSR